MKEAGLPPPQLDQGWAQVSEQPANSTMEGGMPGIVANKPLLRLTERPGEGGNVVSAPHHHTHTHPTRDRGF